MMDIIQQLIRDEGSRRFAYVDTVGKITVGVGRNLSDVGLSSDEIAYLLANDVAKVKDQLQQFDWYQGLDDVRQGAIQNMAFNMGIGGLLHFPHMLSALAIKEWQTAHDEALNSTWATQVGARAQRLATQLLTGQWQ